jgi:hypothetical protein
MAMEVVARTSAVDGAGTHVFACISDYVWVVIVGKLKITRRKYRVILVLARVLTRVHSVVRRVRSTLKQNFEKNTHTGWFGEKLEALRHFSRVTLEVKR